MQSEKKIVKHGQTMRVVEKTLRDNREIVLSDFKDKRSIKNYLYQLKREGWELKRIGERGNITGYRVIGEPL